MTEDRAPRETRQETTVPGKAKKVYQKPAFRCERVFETLALSCGKIGPNLAQCQFARKTS